MSETTEDDGPEAPTERIRVTLTFMGRRTVIGRTFTNEFLLTQPGVFHAEVRAMLDDLYADFIRHDTR